jgi:predicted peroxiredoxin
MKKRPFMWFSSLFFLLIVFSCQTANQTQQSNTVEDSKPVMFFSLTSSGTENPHPITMALQLANHSLAVEREVVLFFNVKAVDIPTHQFKEDIAFRAEPIKKLLLELMEKGAQVHVCPHCMNALEVKETDLISGAMVTDREKLFSKLGNNTVVFTY